MVKFLLQNVILTILSNFECEYNKKGAGFRVRQYGIVKCRDL